MLPGLDAHPGRGAHEGAMKSIHLLLPLAVLLAGAGCSDSEDEAQEPCASVVSRGITQPLTAFLAVGTPADLTVRADEIPRCQDRQGTRLGPDTVTAEVYGPGNTLVPSDILLHAEAEPPWARLRFTPPLPGAYHAIVSFAPVGGLQQMGLLAGTDRSGMPVVAELSRTSCAHVDRTSKGTWLCDDAALSPGAQAWRTLGNRAKVAVAGDVVWVADSGRVQRFVDTGTSLELTATVSPREFLDDTSSRLATENELVLRSGDWVHRITFTQDQGLTAHPAFRWPAQQGLGFGEDQIRALLVRSGERVLWVYNESQGPGSQSRSHACPLQLGAHGGIVLADAPCEPLPGVPVGSEPGALWVRTYEVEHIGDLRVARDTLHRWAAREGRLVEQAVLPLRALATLQNRSLGVGDVVPLLFQRASASRVALPALSPEQDALVVELFSSGSRASSRFLWTHGTGSPVRVYER